MQLPRLVRLVDVLDRSSERSAWRTLVISACVPRRSPSHREDRRPRVPGCAGRSGAPAPPAFAPAIARRPPYCRSQGEGARRLEIAPAAGVLMQRARPRVDLGDPGHRPVEEDAIVRDDREPARESVDEAFEPVEPVEVQIVRRLVEQEHVEAGEQDRRQPGPRRLAARERRRLLVERDGQPELRARRARPRLEIRASEREEALERGRVRIGAPAGGVPLDRRLRVGDAGAARQVGQERLPRAPVVLLRQVADGQRCRASARPGPRPARRALRAGGAASTCRPRWGRRARAASAGRASGRRGRERCGRRTNGRRRGVRSARSLQRTRGRGRARERRGERLGLV